MVSASPFSTAEPIRVRGLEVNRLPCPQAL